MSRNITRRDALAVFGGLAAFGIAACSDTGSDGSPSDHGQFKIGVLQLTEHKALDAANAGFVQALDAAGLKYTIDQQNAQNDQSACQTIASKLVNDGNDLILAIATPACQAVAGATADIPIVGTAITDYAASGLVADNDAPGGNVTGTSDLTPVEEQFDLLRKLLPNAKRVAVLYCTAESNSSVQAGMAHDAASARNLDAEDYTVSSSNEIQQVVESMIGKVDVIYAPTDNTIAAGRPSPWSRPRTSSPSSAVRAAWSATEDLPRTASTMASWGARQARWPSGSLTARPSPPRCPSSTSTSPSAR